MQHTAAASGAMVPRAPCSAPLLGSLPISWPPRGTHTPPVRGFLALYAHPTCADASGTLRLASATVIFLSCLGP